MQTLLLALLLIALAVAAMKTAGITLTSGPLLLWLVFARPPRLLKPPSIA